ncbi:hypothetical protein [Actinoplanes rectilineatus]|uniref:hypothetical protein n=1 Tax=Actinoplanes rectilineatus TaxID=113571 RepID=UPI000AD0D92A|nr:hypothetical protein [Actinoplanes rectilineatus]
MNPVDPRPTRNGLEPPLNDTRADRWLNSTDRTGPTAALARPTVDNMRREWQHHVEQLRRRTWTIAAVAAILVAVAVTANVVHGRFATRCAPSISAAPVVVTP